MIEFDEELRSVNDDGLNQCDTCINAQKQQQPRVTSRTSSVLCVADIKQTKVEKPTYLKTTYMFKSIM